MTEIGGMPRRVFVYSAVFHVAVVLTLFGLVHWHFFSRPLPEETPIVVQLINLAPETRATQVTRTPPKPEKPQEVAQEETPKPPKPEPPKPPPPTPPPSPKPEPPKPEPPKPEPPKPEPPKPPPQEAKLEAPKPEPPKPEPPKPAPPPAKPAPPKKKNDDTDFDALLKNLAKKDPARTPVEQPAKQAAAAPSPKASSQPVAPLGSQLTTSETDLIKQQLYACWNIPLGARDAKNLTPEFRVFMNSDGTVRDAQQLNPERNGDPYFQAAAESAMRALRNPRCQPLKFPPQKYEQWQTFTITFDPKDVS